MTVAELIALLQQENPAAQVLLVDPDTEWLLHLQWGNAYSCPQSDDPPRDKAVMVFAKYGDEYRPT